MSKNKHVRHCWRDGPSILDWIKSGKDIDAFVGSTCMLERGHDGPHEFTPDDHIGIMFPPLDDAT